ncbi:DDE-type integrase/transposase/recombinase [Streptomyces sp. NPDC093591]|uniref:DDE-type integrase/transposase/recombinase n=1 Tax=Streptomyces sp. NPDC093591 TaxID=3366044 RepID=UPI0037F4773A
MHDRGTEAARASKRTGPGTGKVGYTYLHTAIDDHSRLACTEAMDDEKAVPTAAFWHRSVAFFAAHEITPIRRVLTDNGSCYRSRAWTAALVVTGTKHKRTRPYTPRTNGKVERFNGTLAREWAYVRDYASEQERRATLADSSTTTTTSARTPRSEAGHPSAGPLAATTASCSTSHRSRSTRSRSSSPWRMPRNQRPEAPHPDVPKRHVVIRNRHSPCLLTSVRHSSSTVVNLSWCVTSHSCMRSQRCQPPRSARAWV